MQACIVKNHSQNTLVKIKIKGQISEMRGLVIYFYLLNVILQKTQ